MQFIRIFPVTNTPNSGPEFSRSAAYKIKDLILFFTRFQLQCLSDQTNQSSLSDWGGIPYHHLDIVNRKTKRPDDDHMKSIVAHVFKMQVSY